MESMRVSILALVLRPHLAGTSLAQDVPRSLPSTGFSPSCASLGSHHQKRFGQAERNLKVFCQVFERIYGLRFATINFHLLGHLSDCVRLYGPLWTTSCFPFENANGFLVRCLTGTHNSVLNMTNSALCLQHIRNTKVQSKAGRNLIDKFLGMESVDRRDKLELKGGNCSGSFCFPDRKPHILAGHHWRRPH